MWRDLEGSVAMDARSAANCGELSLLLESCGGGGVEADEGEWTALMYACARQSSAAVDVLLRLGADVGARDAGGQTALMIASKAGDAHVVLELLRAGADPTARDVDGRSALQLAVLWGQTAVMRALLPPPPADLPALLHALGLHKYAPLFAGLHLTAFLDMSEADLRDVGVTLLGPRKKMAQLIARCRAANTTTTTSL